MSYPKGVFKAAGYVGGGIFMGCCVIPIAGPLVGLAVGGVTAGLIVAGGLTGGAVYYGVKGVSHKVKSHNRHQAARKYHERQRAEESRRIQRSSSVKEKSVNDIEIDDEANKENVDKGNKGISGGRKNKDKSSSVTEFGIYQPVRQGRKDGLDVDVNENNYVVRI